MSVTGTQSCGLLALAAQLQVSLLYGQGAHHLSCIGHNCNLHQDMAVIPASSVSTAYAASPHAFDVAVSFDAGLALIITVPVVLACKARRRRASRQAAAAATVAADAATTPLAAAAAEETAVGLATIQEGPITPLVKEAAPMAPLAVEPQVAPEPDSPSTPPGDQEARRAAETPATGAAAPDVPAPRSSGSFDASSDEHPHKSSGDAHVVLPAGMVAEAPAGAQVKVAAAKSPLYKDDSANLSDAPAAKAAGQPPLHPGGAQGGALADVDRRGSMDVASGYDDDCSSQVSMVTDVATGLKKPRRIRPVKNTRKMVDNMRRSFDRGAELLRRASFQSSRSSIDVGSLRNAPVH